MHRLLENQIQQATRSDGSLELELLLGAIDTTYRQAFDPTDFDTSEPSQVTAVADVRTAAEERALRAERQLIDAINAMSDAFALYDPSDHLVLCNDRYRQMFGNGVDEIVGLTFQEVMMRQAMANQDGYDRKEMRRMVARRLEAHTHPTGQPHLFPIPGGRWAVIKEFRTSDGGIVGIRTDVTELKQREAELEALKRRYELILDCAGDGIVGLDCHDVVTFANIAASRMLGFAGVGFEGRPIAEIVDRFAGGGAGEARPAPGAEPSETLFRRADGSTFVGEYLCAPLIRGGVAEGTVLVFRDISLRKRYEEAIADQQRELERQVAERTEKLSAEIKRRALIEQALMRSQGRLSGITSNLVECVFLLDPYGHILFANRSAHKFLGAQAGQLPGTEIDDAMHLEQARQPIEFAQTPWPGVIETGETFVNDDAVFVLPDGKRHHVAYACSPLEEDGKRRGAIISFRSIEALKEAQRETLQASRLASVGQLAAGIAHEINTPVQYIGDNLRFLSESLGVLNDVVTQVRNLAQEIDPAGTLTEKLVSLFDEKDLPYLLDEMPAAATQSLEGVHHVAHIVRSMKEFSHPGSTAKVATDLNRAIDSVVTVSRNEWKHIAKMETDLDPDLPAILCFPADINQVLLNLIVNAAHAVEQSGKSGLGLIRISTRREKDCVEIRVADSGPGVPEAIRDRIFDPFFTTKPVGKGTGQGLAISWDVIVNKHGGSIFLDEAAGEGATFVVRLPLMDGIGE